MTIFGFNTDVKTGDTVYHVQSEARENDLLLQTQVFMKGQCIGKRAASYAERTVQPQFSSEEMHELLKSQHRLMLEAVRAGRVQSLFLADGEVQDVNGHGLAVKWLNSDAIFSGPAAKLSLRVSDQGEPADGALITARLALTTDAPIHSQSATETDGSAELELSLPEGSSELPVLVRAMYGEKSVTRKFRLKRS
jgi:hypothetical protein